MKKPIFLLISIFFEVGITGCHSSTAPNTGPGSFNPLIAVAPDDDVDRYERGQKYDVGIAFFRGQDSDGTQPKFWWTLPYGAMAFQVNGYAFEAGSANINGNELIWQGNSGEWGLPGDYENDSVAIGDDDSVTFGYQNFEGESFSSKAAVAPSFGTIIVPDTISASLGWTFRYEHSVPGDSIYVSAQDVLGIHGFGWANPDTGGFTIRPNQLIANIPNLAINSYSLYIYRTHWNVITSPKGKQIAVFSSQRIMPQGFWVKP
jgi:hypothetical protein